MWGNDSADVTTVHEAVKRLIRAYETLEGKIYKTEISLAGVWSFQTGAYKVGDIPEDFVTLPGTMDENQKGAINTNTSDKTRLSPRYTYVGKAVYQRSFVVPDNWEGKKVTLTLERTRETKVWLNDVMIGESDALGVAQHFDLTDTLNPVGENILTVEVDNGSYEQQTWRSHMVVEETQGNWNGIVGEISLKMQAPIYIDDLRIYSHKMAPEDETINTARIQLDVGNLTENAADVTVSVTAKSRNTNKPEQVLPEQCFSGEAAARGVTSLEFLFDMGDNVYLWDEFDPALYEFTITLTANDVTEKHVVSSGMREFTSDGDHFIINGKTIFLRGEANCAVFPLTAYPPMDKASWLELLGIAQEYGLNHYRFHSWSPPKAAYEAADELGMYLQPELYAFTGNPFAAGSSEKGFYSRESERILKQLASHPSFTMFAFGNEMFPSQPDAQELVSNLRELDSTRLYASGSNNRCGGQGGFDPGDDFWTSLSSNKGDTQIRGSNGESGFINMEAPATTRTYYEALDGIEIPFVSHEIGQFQQYPDFDQIEKYTGVFDARNLKIAKASLESKGMGGQNQAFAEASGALAAICYRAEVEAALRTSNMGGYQLLGLQDFPGQGSALIGMLNNFMEVKPGMPSSDEFKRYNSAITALALMPKYVWVNDEPFTAEIQIANYGAGDLIGVQAYWKLMHQDGTVIAEGNGETVNVPQGSVTTVCEMSAVLTSITAAEQLRFEVGLVGNEVLSNEYDAWVFPSELHIDIPADIMLATSYNSQVEERLAAGGKVLMLPKINASALPKSVNGNFTPTFWSGMWFPTTFNTMGFVTDENHPIFADFPTESHSNWQWWNLLKNSRPIILDDTDHNYFPILQAIDNFGNDKIIDGPLNNRKLGLIFEGQVNGGELLVCSIDLLGKNQEKPEARQLLSSILQYMESDNFAPEKTLEADLLRELIPGRDPSGSIAVNDTLLGYPMPFASYSLEDIPNRLWKIIDDNCDVSEANNSWTNWDSMNTEDYIGIDFGREIRTSIINIHIFTDHGCKPPKTFDLQYWNGTNWVSTANQQLTGKNSMTQGENPISFDEIITSKLRLVMEVAENEEGGGSYSLAVSEFQVFGSYHEVPVENVSLNKSTVSLAVGNEENLIATVLPSNATNKNIAWETSDATVATVENGKIIAVAIGTATITVKTTDGEFTADCTVIVETEPDFAIQRHTIKSGAGKGGSISPAGTVRVEQNADKTFTVKADEGYAISDVLVDGASVGAVESYTFEKVTKAHTITAEFCKATGETETGFNDVAGNNWYSDSVAYVTEAGLFNGVGGGKFAPMDSMTRAMFFTVLHRMSGEDTGEAGETWYSNAMEWAVAQGISDGTAREANITREQLAVMLYRYAKAEKTQANLSRFTDSGSISDWALDAMNWAVAEGIITGKTGGKLDPFGLASRAEVATMLQRFIENTLK